MRLSAPSSWSPCQDPQQGRWRRVGRILQTRSRRTRPRRSPAASPSTPPRSGGSPSPSWSPRGRPRRGTPVSWCRTGRNKPDQRNTKEYKLFCHFRGNMYKLGLLLWKLIYLETLDLIVGEVGRLVDLVKVNVSIRVCWRHSSSANQQNPLWHIYLESNIYNMLQLDL